MNYLKGRYLDTPSVFVSLLTNLKRRMECLSTLLVSFIVQTGFIIVYLEVREGKKGGVTELDQ